MDPAAIFKFITNSTWMVTQLLGEPVVEFGRQEYNAMINENTRPGPLLQVTVKVAIQEAYVHFDIIAGNDGHFSIDKYTGRINLIKPLDFERKQKHDLTVSAQLGDDVSQARVVVNVLDENDNKPSFPRDIYETQITEDDDRHLPKPVIKVPASDADMGRYGILKYSLSSLDQNMLFEEYFSIVETTGEILLEKSLDRDPPEGKDRWRLKVSATDGENVAETVVIVNVKDVNDNPPFFPEEVLHASVMENTPGGTAVMTVFASDNDDETEGGNARLTYTIEKNVIDEITGSPIFAINNKTGQITTALCCLDREKTSQYSMQVVATDGGGMKGTGTVIVEILDENDVPPRFTRTEWSLNVPEEQDTGDILASMTVFDPDLENDFAFRIVNYSGVGWNNFKLVNPIESSHTNLISKIKLDYENPSHRNGFKFQVEVTDQGEEGWSNPKHIDKAWVIFNLKDVNDNDPYFEVPYEQRSLPEDVVVGSEIATFKGKDADGGGKIQLRYSILPSTNPSNHFDVDLKGTVKLVRNLDWETDTEHLLLIFASDKGVPERTATATLSIDVTDVNDNPPYLKSPSRVRVQEGSEAKVIAQVQLGDIDNWSKGFGPPFQLKLDPVVSPHIRKAISVSFDPEEDGGRGLGRLRTLMPLDREERHELLVPLLVSDAGVPRQTATVTLTLKVSDVNDNPMKAASKRVLVHLTEKMDRDAPLGRVFVHDPDDWDTSQKSYVWKTPHPLFVLNSTSGNLSMRPGAKPGRYLLRFGVSDHTLGQSDVPANVSVSVKTVSKSALTNATPITLSIAPEELVRRNLNKASTLDLLVDEIQSLISNSAGNTVEDADVVSVDEIVENGISNSRVWLSFAGDINLQHLLLFKSSQIEKNLKLDIITIGSDLCSSSDSKCKSGCWTRVDIEDGYSLVDARTSSIVGPALNLSHGCGCHPPSPKAPLASLLPVAHPVIGNSDPFNCSEESCLNGGKCVPTRSGFRCICPQGTHGNKCKILSRKFDGPSAVEMIEDEGGGREQEATRKVYPKYTQFSWAWAEPIPSCKDVHLSVEILTKEKDATIIFSSKNIHHMKISKNSPRIVKILARSRHSSKIVKRSDSERNIAVRHTSRWYRSNAEENSANETSYKIENRTNFLDKELYNYIDDVPHFKARDLSSESDSETVNPIQRTSNISPNKPQQNIIFRKDYNFLLKKLTRFNSIRHKSGIILRKNMKSKHKENRLRKRYAPSTVNTSPAENKSERDILWLELRQGKPHLLLDLGAGPVTLFLNDSKSLADNVWHRLDIIWRDELVELIVDLCSGTGIDLVSTVGAASSSPDAHTCRIASRLPQGGVQLNTNAPLQVGGIAYGKSVTGSTALSLPPSFLGCIRNVRINGEFRDLGNAILSARSTPGCSSISCLRFDRGCGEHGRCVGSPGKEKCECDLGWKGDYCSLETKPSYFHTESFISFALSFAPFSFTTSIKFRMKTWSRSGELFGLSSSHGDDYFGVRISNGVLCSHLNLHPTPPLLLCLQKVTVSDGTWHDVKVMRIGTALLLSVDDGDGIRYNSSLFMDGRSILDVNRQDGLRVGGIPEHAPDGKVIINKDFKEGCIDDVRLQDVSLPLVAFSNMTSWAQITKLQHVTSGCEGPNSCRNVTCRAPTKCIDSWRSYYCGCGEGKQLDSDGTKCLDINECSWDPCLNKGLCENYDSGYKCICPRGFLGPHCQLDMRSKSSSIIPMSGLIALVSSVFLILAVVILILVFKNRRKMSYTHKCDERQSPDKIAEEASLPSVFHVPRDFETDFRGCSVSQQGTIPTNSLELQQLECGIALPVMRKNCICDVDVLRVETPFLSTTSLCHQNQPMNALSNTIPRTTQHNSILKEGSDRMAMLSGGSNKQLSTDCQCKRVIFHGHQPSANDERNTPL